MYRIEARDGYGYGGITDVWDCIASLEKVTETITRLLQEGTHSADELTVYQEIPFTVEVKVKITE